MHNLKFIKIFIKEINFNLRVFFYKAIIVFILAIIFFKLTIGDKINKINDLVLKIDQQIDKIQNLTTNFNSVDIQNKLKENLRIRTQREFFFNDMELLELLVKSKIKIYQEIETIDKKKIIPLILLYLFPHIMKKSILLGLSEKFIYLILILIKKLKL
jgi:hypothetical protein